MNDKIVIVTEPYEQKEIVNHYWLLFEKNLHPEWYRKLDKKGIYKYVIIRPALKDDFKQIITSLKTFTERGWEKAIS